MMLYAATTALLLLAAVSQNSAQKRDRRETFAAYSGSVNGQQYGGTYHKPDNGPAVVNRFGNEPQLGSSAGGASGSNYAPQFPFVNIPSFQGPPDFNNFYQNYFKQLNDNLAAAFRRNSPHSLSASSASASFLNDGAFSNSFAQQQAAFDAARNAFQSVANRYGPNDSNFNGAAASASFGPGGGNTAAGIFPENPSKPNINTRFESEGPQPGSNVYGISTSAHSQSSNINGVRKNQKEAVTTINDNGKIRTYSVNNEDV